MEEGRQKSKRLSYMTKYKREVRCSEEKGNHKAAAVFGVDESNVQLWRKHKAAISGCEVSRRKFTGPKKDDFLKFMMIIIIIIIIINCNWVVTRLQWQ
jgi:hypothetical protein